MASVPSGGFLFEDWMGFLYDLYDLHDVDFSHVSDHLISHHLRVPGGCGNCRGCGCGCRASGFAGFRSKLWSFKEKVRDSFRSYLHHRRTGRCRMVPMLHESISEMFRLVDSRPVQAIRGLEDCHQFGWTRRM